MGLATVDEAASASRAVFLDRADARNFPSVWRDVVSEMSMIASPSAVIPPAEHRPLTDLFAVHGPLPVDCLLRSQAFPFGRRSSVFEVCTAPGMPGRRRRSGVAMGCADPGQRPGLTWADGAPAVLHRSSRLFLCRRPERLSLPHRPWRCAGSPSPVPGGRLSASGLKAYRSGASPRIPA